MLMAEAQPEPRVDQGRFGRRDQRVLTSPALREPLLRSRCVEIADVLGILDCVTGGLHPDVRAPAGIVLAGPEQVADDAPGAEPHDPIAAQGLHLGPVVVAVAEQRLGLTMSPVALCEQRGGAVQMLLGKRVDFETRHRRGTIPLPCEPQDAYGRRATARRRTCARLRAVPRR